MIPFIRALALAGPLLLGFVPHLVGQTHREVKVPLRDGHLSVLALSRALLDEYGYAGDALRFRDVRIDVGGVRGALLLRGVSKSLADTVRFRRVEGDDALLVRVDQARARAVRHEMKARVGRVLGVLTGKDLMARQYSLRVPEALAADEPLVIGIHGVDATARTFADLRAFLAAGADGIEIGTFAYANDEAVDRIAEELAARLKTIAKRAPDRRVVLLGHSMGGLVARYMLETEELDPGNVSALIMLGVPNHGSRLSRLRPGVDVLEFFRDHGDQPKLLGPMLDGLGEAGWDLWPDSPFLANLNRRPRNESVAYRLILGDKGLISQEELVRRRAQIMAVVGKMKKHEIYAGKIEAWLSDLDEVVQGKGDGAVSLARGRMRDVETVVLPLTHHGLMHSPLAFAQVRAWIEAVRQ